MTTTLEALILGVLQGLTEFLPVSSSGHLALAQHLLGMKSPPIFLDVMLHGGTFLATVVVLRKEVWALVLACRRLPRFVLHLFQKGHLAIGDDPSAWTVVLILFTTLVTAAIGLAFHDRFVEAFASLHIVSAGLFITGILLFFTRNLGSDEDRSRYRRTGKSAVTSNLKDAMTIGLAQGIALLPGISRSGATISTALFRGFNRKFAGEYSFLVSLPAVAGAIFLESMRNMEPSMVSWTSVALGSLAAFLFGVITLKLLLNWIRRGKLVYFAFYCWLAAGVALTL